MDAKLSRRVEKTLIAALIVMGYYNIGLLALWWFNPVIMGNPVLYAMLSVSLWLFVLRASLYWIVIGGIEPLEEKQAESQFSADCFTTAAPGEPVEMTQKSLLALRAMRYPHQTFLLDDSNNPALEAWCRQENIGYISRTEKKNAKCGNVNNGLEQTHGDLVMIIDPDHIVTEGFLSAVVPYFEDPRVGFVQVAQAYYNQRDSLIARAGAEQTYLFYGPVMQGLARYNANLVIGTNSVFRRAALESIGLYKPGLAEDLHTSMALHGKGWKSVYLPRILARGLTPSDLGAFFHQQVKWSRGVMELLFEKFPGYARGMTLTQRILYLLNMSYYFEAVSIAFNLLIPVFYFLFGLTPLRGDILPVLYHFVPIVFISCFFFFWAQKYDCDRQEQGLLTRGMIMRYLDFTAHLLGIGCAVLGIRIPYIPTAKTREAAFPFVILLPQFLYAALLLLLILLNFPGEASPGSTRWAMLGFSSWNVAIILLAIFWAYLSHKRIVGS